MWLRLRIHSKTPNGELRYVGLSIRGMRMIVNPDKFERKLSECESNSCIMDILFEENLINAEQPKLLYAKPRRIDCVQLSKVDGMLFGVPIGDALGSPFEGKPPSKENFKMIHDYLPEAHITDDTQLTFWTLEVFLRRGWFDPKALADRFSSE